VLANIPVRLLYNLKTYVQTTFEVSDGGLDFEYGRHGMRILPMQMGALRYALKGLDPHAFRYHGYDPVNIADALGIIPDNEGRVPVKRAGCTQNIGPKARRQANWRDLRSLDELKEALHPIIATRGLENKATGT
jgi:hypothetical protein